MQLAHVPYTADRGEKEMNEQTVSLRIQGQGDQGSISEDTLILSA